jgi:hypothetical protein
MGLYQYQRFQNKAAPRGRLLGDKGDYALAHRVH